MFSQGELIPLLVSRRGLLPAAPKREFAFDKKTKKTESNKIENESSKLQCSQNDQIYNECGLEFLLYFSQERIDVISEASRVDLPTLRVCQEFYQI